MNCENHFKILDRRLEEIKDGKELTDLMMTDETRTVLINMKTEKAILTTTKQQEQKLNNLKLMKWVKNRSKVLDDYGSINVEMDLAKEMFNLWDEKSIGQVTIDQIAEQLISLGLNRDKRHTQQLVRALKTKNSVTDNFLTLDEFMKCFNPDRLGLLFISKVNEQFYEDQNATLNDKILSMLQQSVGGSGGDKIKQRAQVKSLVSKLEIRKPTLADRADIIAKWYEEQQNEDGIVTRNAIA